MLIIATVGLHDIERKTRKLILTGADILRFNFSRREPQENIEFVKTAKQIGDELHSDVKILVDMPVKKIRLGDFDIKTFAVRENEEFTCKSAPYSPDCNDFIPVDTKKLGERVNLNQIITIGDGEIAIQVTEIIDSETIKIRVLNNGIFQYMRTFNIKTINETDSFIEDYVEIINKLKNVNIQYIAISYVDKNTNEKIKQLPYLGKERPEKLKVIAKIEDLESIKDAELIFQDNFYNMVLMDRGEVGVNIPFEKLAIAQKKLTNLSKKYKKPLIISSQILESTINNFIPNRSEILGITNMVLDNIQGIMFCKETGFQTRPAYTISVARKIIEEAKKHKKRIDNLI